MARETGQHGHGHTVAFRETDLKICDLCGWLNLASNSECFVCGWHGHFEHDPDTIHAAMELAMRRRGRLDLQDLTDLRTYHQSAAPTLRMRFRGWLARVWIWLRS